MSGNGLPPREQREAIVVGARCAGSTLALALARRGCDVLLIDRDTFPSETTSTHLIFPNTLARFEQLGVLDRLRAAHQVPLLESRIVGFGHRCTGPFTPVDGFDRAAAPRRSALDKAIFDTALAAGAQGRFGERVVDLIGSGTTEDPVRGVVLESGERIGARWVFGADGRGSTVAGRLGIEKTRPDAGEMAFLFAYWRGLPDDGYATTEIRPDAIVNRWAVEDGLHLLSAAGPPEFTRGSKEVRMRRYLERLRDFPETIEPEVLEGAEMVSDLLVAPESLMRGFFRTPAGPGWALVGDACHFKHPATAQGIADAIEQGLHVADGVSGNDPLLAGYAEWRDRRAREHYEWSFVWGRFPRAKSEGYFHGWATEADAGQDLRDSFSRLVEPSVVMSKERLSRWFEAPGARPAAAR
ncbi:MAG TPA: NAD(P)/FAD-dependent oxidoreductase [Solirubrobacterales bacterium]|jgi:2-polyprenyl-6-methoxyphenol hydroxylase-like FAD-dependent oxidoreductase|nr:NAD(P)/FAD-dependent oxidoreductase [Solirubrobacterales bacterium]